MEARLQQVDLLLREQKAAMIEQERQHQQSLFQRRSVRQKEVLDSGNKERGGAVDTPEALTPRMSFERQLSDELLKQLLEKVFGAADEDKTGMQAARANFLPKVLLVFV